MNSQNKILITVSTYNQLEYTKLFYEYYSKLNLNADLIIIDDCSNDGTVNWCKENSIKIIEKDSGKGLTHSWNLAYQYFKEHDIYDYLIIASNDIILPIGSIDEIIACHKKWPSVCIVPLTSQYGCGHNPVQSVSYHYGDSIHDENNVQEIQDRILSYRDSTEMKNRRFLFDPIRMLMFSGFCFSLKRDIIRYERNDGLLFNPLHINYKNDDDFNWSTLIPNDEYPMLCKTSYVYHFKGKSFAHIKDARTDDLETFLKNR